MCDLPLRPNGERREELSLAEWIRVIDDIAADGGGSFGINGGEPLLRRDLPEILSHIRAKDLPVAVSTNGLLLNNDRIRERFLDHSPTAVNISVDGADAKTYDTLRGREGGWNVLLQAVNRLVRDRDRRGIPLSINAVCVLSPATLPKVRAITHICESLGFDSIGFMPIEEIASVNAVYPDALPGLWSNQAKRAQLETVVGTIEWLLTRDRAGEGIRLENSRAYLEALPLAFLGRESPSPCVTGHLNTFIDPYGDVFPCWPYHEWKRPAIGNVRETSWREVWRSQAYRHSREETRKCRACFWDCQLEENVFFHRPELNGLQVAREELLRASSLSTSTPVDGGAGGATGR
jgi:MoaA/NifB/PqqE/SkfB family radical SAM enzyme